MAKVAKDNRPFADQKTSELACTYAALILHDDKQDVWEIITKIDGNKINKLIKAANLKVEPFWAKVFEKALKGKNVSDLLVGGGAPTQGAATVAETAAPAKEAPKAEEKKPAKVEEPEEDVDMGGLFDWKYTHQVQYISFIFTRFHLSLDYECNS